MDTVTINAGKGWREARYSREAIDLVSDLWVIECRHQLGILSRAAYLKAVADRRRTAKTSTENNDE